MKRIGIGFENYKDFIEQDLYYVDKTLLVRDILRMGGKATLLTRHRRFGKTSSLSMLQTFFELEYDREGNIVDKSRYFSGMKIMACGEEILARKDSSLLNERERIRVQELWAGENQWDSRTSGISCSLPVI